MFVMMKFGRGFHHINAEMKLYQMQFNLRNCGFRLIAEIDLLKFN